MADQDFVARGSAVFVGALEDTLRAVEHGETIGDEDAVRELRALRGEGRRSRGERDGCPA